MTPLEEIFDRLPIRAKACLQHHGITTPEQFAEMSDYNLERLSMPNVGKGTIIDIREALQQAYALGDSRMTPEGRVKNDIKTWLREISAYIFMPVQTGYGATSLDLLVCLNGRFIGIETKRPGIKDPSPRQRLVMDAIEAAGGQAYCVDSLEELIRQYDTRNAYMDHG